MKLTSLILALLCALGATAFTPNAGVINVVHRHKSEENGLEIDITPTNGPLTHGILGLSLPSSIGQWNNCDDTNPTDFLCATWGDFATVRLKPGKNPAQCTRIEWTSPFARELQDCFDITPSVHWYGGGEVFTQRWPVETQPLKDGPFLTGTSDFGGVLENFWLLSSGAFIVVDPDVPLHHSINTTHQNRVCFTSRDQTPYNTQSPLTLNYEVCSGTDVKNAQQLAMSLFFDKPSGIPDELMMIKPFWSTWAEYKTGVNQSIVLEYARSVVSEGFGGSSHIEIDDNWEGCYGDVEFDTSKFPDAKGMVEEIKGLGMRVTVWVHPFVNYGCRTFDDGFKNGYFLKTPRGKTAITSWWQGSNAGAIDVTNPDAVKWYADRLHTLQATTGVDSFKFDAGEVNWLPSSIAFTDENIRGWPNPNVYTTAYVDAVAQFGGLIETRAGHLNQKNPVFVRMLDKSSSWGYGNGLKSLIPTLLLFGVLGYPFVLPDMIGGNAYGEGKPGKEMYVRWMEANVFMPGVQFSIVPWGYDEETVRICIKILALREKYSDVILAAARQAVEDGSPVNRPLWWVAPNDSVTFTIDDEYMLGDTILVAPVVEDGARSRDIYLPEGTWSSGVDSNEYVGPRWVMDYPAPLDVVPFFVKVG